MLQKLFRRTPVQVADQESGLAEIDKQVKRLAREIYKTNTLAESQLEQNRQAAAVMKATLETLQASQKNSQEAAQAIRVDAVKALFPVIDSVEAGITSGALLLSTLDGTSAGVIDALKGWLDGQRLILERLDNILEAEGIQRIPTIGRPFDPHYHVAVKSGYDPQQSAGLILKEERRGYWRGGNVLRYAEVIVNRGSGESAA
jgi:molecular chaperone GrpE